MKKALKAWTLKEVMILIVALSIVIVGLFVLYKDALFRYEMMKFVNDLGLSSAEMYGK